MSQKEYHNTADETQQDGDTSIPLELRQRPQWVVCGPRKEPRNVRTGGLASPTDPATWSTYDPTVMVRLAGFVFTADDPYFVIDLDKCRNPETGEIEAWALAIVHRFPIYWEISQSGTGLHGIGYGTLPKAGNRRGSIEVYDQERYVALTGDVLPGCETIRNCQRILTEWHHEVWPLKAPRQSTAVPPTITLDDRELIERVRSEKRGNGKGARLLAGDASDHHSPSEARMALAYKLLFYGATQEQVVRILRAHGPWKDGDSDSERDRKAKHDAGIAVKDYDGKRWEPRVDSTAGDDDPPATETLAGETIDAMTCDEVRAQLKANQLLMVEKDAQIVRQAGMIREARGLIGDLETILASTELQLGPRAVAAAVVMELHAQRRKPTEDGYQIPAVWIARRTGLSTKVANGHLQSLDAKGIITRKVKTVHRGEDVVDTETGEIFTVDVPRKVGFIAADPKAIVTNLAEYRRQAEDTKHGGKGERCSEHPNAGTVKRWTLHCAECDKPLDYGETRYAPDGTEAPSPHDGYSDNHVAEDIPVAGSSKPGADTEPGMYVPRRCKDCRAVLAPTEHERCPACVTKHGERPAPHQRRLILNRRTCVETGCTSPPVTGSHYCASHGGAVAGMVAS